MSQAAWWRGQRGEWYVVAQAVLLLLVVFGPTTWPNASLWTTECHWLGKILGSLLILSGALLSLLAAFHLGSNLTPLPYPKEDGELIVNGAYSLVRHPIYSSLILAALGWGLWVSGWLTIGYALMLLVFFDVKSRREEAWLIDKYSEYRDYQQRVRKLIPFIY